MGRGRNANWGPSLPPNEGPQGPHDQGQGEQGAAQETCAATRGTYVCLVFFWPRLVWLGDSALLSREELAGYPTSLAYPQCFRNIRCYLAINGRRRGCSPGFSRSSFLTNVSFFWVGRAQRSLVGKPRNLQLPHPPLPWLHLVDDRFFYVRYPSPATISRIPVQERGLALDPRPPGPTRLWHSSNGDFLSPGGQQGGSMEGMVARGGRGWRVRLGRTVRLELERSLWFGDGPAQPGSLHLR